MVSTHIGFPAETVTVFVVLALGAIFIDLFMHRHDKPISLKSAALWTVFWIVVAMAFAGFLYIHHGSEVASLFITGYAESAVFGGGQLEDGMHVLTKPFAVDALGGRVRELLAK